jgi:hypothetical protein
VDSYGYDGNRQRKWHGGDTDDYTYGLKWNPKEVVTSLIDLDEGTISFLLNMGIAFSNIDTLSVWYPAISFTENQYGEFRFGGKLDKFIFVPKGYLPVTLCLNPGSIENEQISEIKPNVQQSSLSNSIISSSSMPDIFEKYSVTSVGFYFEMAIELTEREPQIFQTGLKLHDGSIYFIAVDSSESLAYFLKTIPAFDPSCVGTTFEKLLEIPEENHGLELLGTEKLHFRNGDVFGVGLHCDDNYVFYSHNGYLIGRPWSSIGGTAIPFIRNIPKYILNFGGEDFRTIAANLHFSPTKIVME